MSITTHPAQDNPSVTILAIQGELDGSNIVEVLEKAQQALDAGAQYLLVDMSELGYMSSAGLSALHSLTIMMQNVQPPEEGKVKLLNPQPRINEILDLSGFTALFDIFNDQDAAIASFGTQESQ